MWKDATTFMMLLPPGVVVVICSSEASLSPLTERAHVEHYVTTILYLSSFSYGIFESSSVSILVPSLRDTSRQESGAYTKGYCMSQELAKILKIKEYQVFSVQGHALKVFCGHTSCLLL